MVNINNILNTLKKVFIDEEPDIKREIIGVYGYTLKNKEACVFFGGTSFIIYKKGPLIYHNDKNIDEIIKDLEKKEFNIDYKEVRDKNFLNSVLN